MRQNKGSPYLWREIARILFLLALTFGLVGCKDPFEGQSHLSDDQLIANFREHTADFERLREMVLDDKRLTRVDEDWTAPTDPTTIGVTAERIAEYRALFKKLGLARGFSAGLDRREIELWASAQGWVAHGSHKGYVYTASVPENLDTGLDQYSSRERPLESGYRRIEGNWYLYFYGD
jgi:hypothetical protein